MEDNQLLGHGQDESCSFPDILQEGDEEVEDQGTGMGTTATVTVSAASPVAVVEVEDEARSPPAGIQVQSCMEADEFTIDEVDGETNKSKSSSFATPESCCPLSSNSNSEHESSPVSSVKQPQRQRFQELQAFLKLCDEADQRELLEALRSLSAAARSGHAFNLEYRALMLSIEEGKEMLRLKMLNVMGNKGKSPPPAPEPGATPVGVRLPAPGSVTDLGEDARL